MLRKIRALFVAFLLIFSLTGCLYIPLEKEVNVRYDVSEIVSVRIYNLGDKIYGSFELMELMSQNFMPVATLEVDQHTDFAEKLTECDFSNGILIAIGAVDPAFPSFSGYIVKITYQNGDYDILSSTGQIRYSGDDYDSYSDSCDDSEWNRFIKAYLGKD